MGLDRRGAIIHDTASARAAVATASGLAAVDLGGLSRLGLAFGFALAAACGALCLGTGFLDARRSQTVMALMGATRRQRGRFLTAEALALAGIGVAGAALCATVIAYLLTKTLTGIFDPPPSHPSIPWLTLVEMVTVVAGALGATFAAFLRRFGAHDPSSLVDV